LQTKAGEKTVQNLLKEKRGGDAAIFREKGVHDAGKVLGEKGFFEQDREKLRERKVLKKGKKKVGPCSSGSGGGATGV